MKKISKETILVSAIQDLARGIQSETDLSSLTGELLKITVEASLNAEMKAHLGYSKHSTTGYHSGNSRNGYGKKSLKVDHGVLEIETPRDRNGTFEPQFVRKNQTRLAHFDDKILALYAKGMVTRDIVDTFQAMYGASISGTQVSNITAAVMEKIAEWQAKSLDESYPVIYLSSIVVNDINNTVNMALGVNSQGHKELLGLWLFEDAGAKPVAGRAEGFWLAALTDLKNRGVKDVDVVCEDALSGFPGAIGTVFPNARIQTCIVYRVRDSLIFCLERSKTYRGRSHLSRPVTHNFRGRRNLKPMLKNLG